jgi:hypothetical protein
VELTPYCLPGSYVQQPGTWEECSSMETVLTSLQRLVRETHISEEEIVALALKAGARHLWCEQVLGRYLRGELARADAVDAVGIDWVELVERQHEAMIEDVAWALDQ